VKTAGRRWTEADDVTLSEAWASHKSREQVMSLFPGRSYHSLTGRAFKIGVQRPNGYRSHDLSPLDAVTDTDAAWLAGMVDGEGTLSFDSHRELCHPFLAVTNTHRPTLDYIQELIGYGSITSPQQKAERAKQGNVFRINSLLWVEAVVDRIYPYLTIKRRAANLVREFIRHRKQRVLTREECRVFVRTAREVNRKGRRTKPVEVLGKTFDQCRDDGMLPSLLAFDGWLSWPDEGVEVRSDAYLND
jgi:hypothetical protein